MFKNLFKSNERKNDRLSVEDISIFIETQEYKLTNLSNSGFAIEGNLKPRVMDQALKTSLKLQMPDKELEISCRAQIIWQRNEEAGLTFFCPTRKELLAIDAFIKSQQAASIH